MGFFKNLFVKKNEEVEVPATMFGTFKRRTCNYAVVNVGYFLNEINKASFEICEDANNCTNKDERRRMYNAAKVLNLASNALQDILQQSSVGPIRDIPQDFKEELRDIDFTKDK